MHLPVLYNICLIRKSNFYLQNSTIVSTHNSRTYLMSTWEHIFFLQVCQWNDEYTKLTKIITILYFLQKSSCMNGTRIQVDTKLDIQNPNPLGTANEGMPCDVGNCGALWDCLSMYWQLGLEKGWCWSIWSAIRWLRILDLWWTSIWSQKPLDADIAP